MNLYRVSAGYVLLDYGHNPAAVESVCRLAKQWRGYNVTGVLSAPGDRCDELIEEVGRIAARGFDRVVIKEDTDRRGRAAGEVAQLLLRAVKDEAPERDCLVVLNEREAVESEIQRIRDGEVVVIFYDQIETIKEALAAAHAVPVSAIDPKPEQFSVAQA